ncbi:MAG: hypothetical protein O7A08_14000, partial [SAR324 cluster bacterium]|nr:hypothetical protein [SAR324 cluster bacterium]
IVSDVVSSPLSAAGTVRGAHTGLNVYLQSPAAEGLDFMDPAVVGYGIPAGGRVEIELAGGFIRDPGVKLTQKAIMVVTGAPQQGMPGKKVGYAVSQGGNSNTYAITPTKPGGLMAEQLMSPAPGAAGDPIRQRGIKVFHIGFLASPFKNGADRGTVRVRFYDGNNKVIREGEGSIRFLPDAVPQIFPNNIPQKQRNHNWQRIAPGETLAVTPGTVPITLNLFEQASGAPHEMVKFKQGIVGAGVLSTQQLQAMGYSRPAALARYNGGLIVKDSNGDGKLDPRVDRIIGGVLGRAPSGAKGQELRTLEQQGRLVLSEPMGNFHPKIGKLFGGAVMQLQFTAGDKPGKYRPTLALLRDPENLHSGDGSSTTYTIVVK